MRSLYIPMLLTLITSIAACWSTEGLGPGPYSEAESAAQCVERGLSGVTAHMNEDGLEFLFCTEPCLAQDPTRCPLAKFVEEAYAGELQVTCVGEASVCALLAAGKCPDGMSGFADDDGVLCYFEDGP